MSGKANSTVAVLGATGSTGGAILSQLLLLPPSSIQINIYVRSPDKLEASHPGVTKRPNISIYSGSMSTSSLKPCLKDVDTIFNVIGTNKTYPGCTLTQETASTIVTALQEISSENKKQNLAYKAPLVILMSSGSCCDTFVNKGTWLEHAIIYNSLYYVYEDLKHAAAYFRSEGEATGLLHLSVAGPGAIFEHPDRIDTPAGRGEGVKISATEFTPMVSYQEIARGMIQVSQNPEKWRGKEFFFVSAQKPAYDQLFSLIIRNVIPGLMVTFIPSLYPLLNKIGWL